MADTVVPATVKPPSSASTKTQLVRLIAQNGTVLFHSPDGHPYATVTIGGHRQTMSLSGHTFAEYLSREYYIVKKRVVGSTDLKDAIRVLTASAIHVGAQHDVFIRLARVGNVIWLDLGRPQWDAIKITADGWAIGVPDVKFRRSRGLLALPVPVRGTESLQAMLQRLINTKDPRLLITWLVGALRGIKPFPVGSLVGEHGAAKSMAETYLRRIIDPNTADLRSPPKDERDLVIAAHNSYVLAYDNLSQIPEWLSDALCRIATGGGFSTRELFTDLNESLFSVTRPILLNGINDIVSRPDLLDRALVVMLDPIADTDRKCESDLDAAFAELHPAILAALLDAVVHALAHESSTTLTHTPRMADFAKWIIAAGPTLGWKDPAEFLDAYTANQDEATTTVLDGDIVVEAIKALKFKDGEWSGQLKELLAFVPDHKYKPKSPRGLRGVLRRLAPALRRIDYEMTFTRGHDRTVTIHYKRESGADDGGHRTEPDDVPF